mgnify:FL=1
MEQIKYVLAAVFFIALGLAKEGPAFAEGFSFTSASLYDSLTVTLPAVEEELSPEDMLYGEHDNSERAEFLKSAEEKFWEGVKIKNTGGIKIAFSHGEGVFSFTTAKDRQAKDIKFSYGIKASTKDLLPFTLTALWGTLGLGGSVSKMRSPFFGIPSAFTGGTSASQGLSATLPAVSASGGGEERFAFGAEYVSKNKNLSVSLDSTFTLQGEWAASAGAQVKSAGLTMGAALTAGSFIYGRKSGTSWFKAEKPFCERNYLSLSGQVWFKNLSLGNILKAEGDACIFVYESPFGGAFLALRTQGMIFFPFLGDARLGFGFSVADRDTVTSSGAKVKSPYQFYTNAQYSWQTGGALSKAGLTFYGEEAAFTIKARYRLSFGSGTILWGGSFSQTDEQPQKLGTELSFSWLFPRLTSVTEAEISYDIKGKKASFTGEESLSFRKSLVQGMTLAVSGTGGEGGVKFSKMTFTMTLKNKSRRIPLTARLSISALF